MNQETKNENLSSQFLKTDKGKTKSNAIEVPSITLPKGGGAIRGIDEKFAVNAVNGTAGFDISFPVSEARGFSPELGIHYSSGAGNSAFGLGWSSGIASIKRQTDKKLPQYDDSNDSDTFILSDSEDLVPEFKKNNAGDFIKDAKGNYVINEVDRTWFGKDYQVKRYRPRIEGLFSRIEKWTEKKTLLVHWRTISQNNVTSFFGNSEKSRIADPINPLRIFEWLLEFSFDDKGNCIYYEYKPENDQDFLLTLHNRNRKTSRLLYSNAYLKRVLYGTRTPYKNKGETYSKNTADYFFETVFDYGEHDALPPFNETRPWKFRTDAFSDYRAGFEIRTTRLCKRVMLYHHFAELPGGSALVKSVDLDYSANGMDGFTFLTEVVIKGYIKQANGVYTQKAMPGLSFKYQPHAWNTDIRSLDPESLVHAPAGVSNNEYHFVDLFSEGLSGILSEQGDGWYYKSNLGEGNFSRASLISPKPSFRGLNAQLQLTELEGDGIKQLAQLYAEPKGFFELSPGEEWQPFTPFEETPNIQPDGYSRMIDLTGDGLADILIHEPDGFTWYPSKGKKGYEASRKLSHSFDDESAPAVIFADTVQSVFLSDMSGDGLSDIVRIKNGEVCYWPNLGYGRFGSKISLDNAPVFDRPDQFNPAHIRLSDIDGSGTSDIVYFGRNKCSIYLNRQGNSLADAKLIDPFPEINQEVDIDIADLLGTGLSCIVWNSPLPNDAATPSKYIDLMGSKKPHVMISYANNMGKKVSLEYMPSTYFYLEDKKAGKPWITKLHFPVHCVSKATITDHITGAMFTSRYTYHHGFYDHHEKEFRGFGMVEQIDSEKFEHWEKSGAANIVDKSLHQDPVLVRSWVHTGAFFGREKILEQFKHEYWYEEMARQGFAVTHHEVSLPEARLIADPDIDPAILDQLTADEWREALRACKGMSLRSEVFALDAPEKNPTANQLKTQLTPFTVGTHNCVIELLQPKGKNEHAVFIVKESESISYSYERDTDDPRIAHTLSTKVDIYGNVLESASVVYPRIKVNNALPQETKDAQAKTAIVYTRHVFTNDVIDDDTNQLRLPSETRTYELKGVSKTGSIFTINDFKDVFDVSVPAKSEEAEYHEINKALTHGVIQRRLIGHSRSVYLSNDLKTPLPLHRLESLALEFESYQLAYTPALLTDIYGAKVNDALMLEGKFMHSEGDSNWWIQSGTEELISGAETAADGQNRFYMPVAFVDPYGAKTTVKYYSNYFLFIEQTEDAAGNKVSADLFDFRTLSPKRMKDMNNNLSEIIGDELGMVKAMAVLGKGNEADDLTGLFEQETVADNALIASFLAQGKQFRYNPVDTDAKDLLKNATLRFVYDLDAFKTNGKPVVAATITREEYHTRNNNSPVHISFEYSNGMGQSVMKKIQAEPGMAWQSNGNGTRTETDTTPFLRWIGNGRRVNNNKGNAVKQYEPYFSTNHLFEDQKELVETGVTPVTYYDALGRAMRTELPDGTFTRVEFDSWSHTMYDQNDTSKDPRCTWYHKRINRQIDAELIAEGKDPVKEAAAADKASKHDNTPAVLHLDTLDRAVLSVEHNKNIVTGADEFYHSRVSLDIEGNLLSVIDPRNNEIASYKYDMLGNKVYQQCHDTGRRWLLLNIMDQPLRSWDERSHEFRYSYDILHRPTGTKVLGGDGAAPLDHIIGRIIYGESVAMPEDMNLRGQVFRHYDTGGLAETAAYDFTGHPVSVKRVLFKNYKSIANWTDANLLPDLEPESYTFTPETDAMGRITRETAPDGSVFKPTYNEAGLLTSEKIEHADPVATITYINDIDYDEKRQRTRIVYGNGVISRYKYDLKTFRLIAKTTRRADNSLLQDLQYTFDGAGTLTHVQDNAIPTVFYDNMQVRPASEFTYDALYRLVEATGRENDAALTYDVKDNWNDNAFKRELNPGDPIAARGYTQKYEYDKAGNIMKVTHRTDNSTANWWTRDYEYETNGNRLKNTKVSQGTTLLTYLYPHHAQHGFITALPHLEDLGWNFNEELIRTVRQRRTDGGTPETTYYQYDGKGQRLRKITENQADPGVAPTKKEERIYIAGYQVYKKHSGPHAGLQRITLGLVDQGSRFVMIETRNNVDDGTEKQLIRYQLHNHLGSACLELDGTAAARVITYEEYHPYGTTAYQVRNKAIKSAAKQYRFTGMERDEETGLEYHSARYYMPWLGRWLNADPIGINGGPNVYEYADSCPVLHIDDSGKASKKKSKSTERKHGEKQQKAFRKKMGLKGAEVQAGHLATVRDAKLSKITPKFWDKAPMLALHSRKGKGLDVTMTHQDGTKTRHSRHTAQEKISDVNTQRSILEQGKLYPRAQLRNAEQFVWQTANVPYDQVNVEAVRKSGPAPKSKVDADIDPKTGEVIEGPNTKAARERMAAKKAAEAKTAAETAPASAEAPAKAAPAEKGPALQGEKVQVPPTQKAITEVKANVKAGAKATRAVRTTGKVAGGALNAILVGVAVKDTVEQIQAGDYKGAATTTGLTVASFTPAAPVVIAYGVIEKYKTDKSIEARAFEAGDIVTNATGSPVLGGIVSAGNAVGLSAYETGKDMYNSAVDFVDWGIGKAFFDD